MKFAHDKVAKLRGYEGHLGRPLGIRGQCDEHGPYILATKDDDETAREQRASLLSQGACVEAEC